MGIWHNGSVMRIIKLAKKKKSSATITELEDGGYFVSVAVENEGYMECDSIFIPSDVEIDVSSLSK